ncbi:lytic polysaccharide monooxygenase [Streptomyces yaanensis]|uniref:Lytic polysaccharide monooxygenase n=1 Tax=Streptomyces yaanensis TaxID=1142239 RepID=A0ABV7SDS2_9ACTN|nr:lytic polysaccharide monooxygenase [Streptomyces sp. CGMCC 4.7035]WNB98512.1 lytic polysaccharide monooxygenase [Streptomyces sp. CGMCC 4.7035]
MTAHRTVAVAAAAVAATLLPATPALAHGAPTDPVSRVVACSPEGGGRARTAACRAAIAANGAPFTAWDNLRVAGVGGRDRQMIPDGRLCSGGLPAYKGLDLARSDWPSTRLTPGASLTMAYSSTIPHTGTFKLFLTKQGYDPTRPLTWSDLPTQPFAQVTDPPLTDGAYRIRAKLPANRSGRHVLFTIWQNSSTTDTYYSCSDVVFPASGTSNASGTTENKATSKPDTAKATPTAARTPSPSPSATASPSEAAASSGAPTPSGPAVTSVPGVPAAATERRSTGGPSMPLLAGGAMALALLAGAAAVALRRRRG